MNLVLALLPSVLAAGTAIAYSNVDGRDHRISVSGNSRRGFDISYTPGTNSEASFVFDGNKFHFMSQPESYCDIPEGGRIHPSSNARNEIQTDCSSAVAPVYNTSPCRYTDIQFILIDGIIKGVGILIVFLCVWLLARRFEFKKQSYIRSPSSRSKLRNSSRVSSLHQHDPIPAVKEYKEAAITASPVDIPNGVNKTLAPGSPSVHTAATCVKCESAAATRKVQVHPVSEYLEIDYSGDSMYMEAETGGFAPVSPIELVPATQKWTPHSDVSRGRNEFVGVPAVLLPPERDLTPPPPPPRTIPNFNPVLSQPRPPKIEQILQVYDFIFLIDDSGSMHGSLWEEARESVNALANWILDNHWDRDGISLRFLNSDFLFYFRDLNGVSDKNKIRKVVNSVAPTSGTPTGRRCFDILNAHIDKLERAKNTPEYGRIKPLILVVITDGAPTDGVDYALSQVLLNASNRLAGYRHHPNSMAVQFVQVGREESAARALKLLTKLNTNGMVDAISSADLGSLSPDKLGQLMLGGVHPNIRSKVT